MTGCPKFQAMTADERRAICMRAKLWMKCCDTKVIFDLSHRGNCKVNKKNKIPGTCVEHPGCVMPSWLCNNNTANAPSNVLVDTTKILKNMKRNSKKRGAELIPITEGDSMFVLAPLKVDSGCSDAVARHGIPGSQLNRMCVNEGPITCLEFGATQIEARLEWIIKL